MFILIYIIEASIDSSLVLDFDYYFNKQTTPKTQNMPTASANLLYGNRMSALKDCCTFLFIVVFE